MNLKELTTQVEKKKMYTYARDCNTVVTRNVSVRNVTGSIYSGLPVASEYGEEMCKIYLYYDGCSIGFALFNVESETPVNALVEYVQKASLDTAQAFVENVRSKIISDSYFKNTEILMMAQIDPSLAAEMQEAKRKFLINKKAQEEKEKEEQDAKNRAYVERQNAEAEEIIDSVISAIRTGGVVENKSVTLYKDRYSYRTSSSFNLLMKRYGINVPLRTQGWINEKLCSVNISNGKCRCATYRRAKNSHRSGSEVFINYMDALITAILHDKESNAPQPYQNDSERTKEE